MKLLSSEQKREHAAYEEQTGFLAIINHFDKNHFLSLSLKGSCDADQGHMTIKLLRTILFLKSHTG